MKFSQKKFDNFEKLNSLSWPFWTLFFEKKMLYPHENQSKVLGYQGWDEILMITLVSSQKSTTPNILAASVLHQR